MEEELRELRLELKSARSDVKRYASYALRLQHELNRERQKHADEILDGCNELDGNRTSLWERKFDISTETHISWSRKIDQVLQMLAREKASSMNRVENTRESAPQVNQHDQIVDDVLHELQPFLRQQQHFLRDLSCENAKLRDTLQARPTRRELVCSQLAVERLQDQMRKLRTRVKDAHKQVSSNGEIHEQSPSGRRNNNAVAAGSLSERITEGKLLRTLRVKTEDSVVQRAYLKEKVHCYLYLDPVRLEKEQWGVPHANILERVGRICSDIVASCCYVLGVEEVGELPRYVEKVYQLAQLSSVYQGFTERLAKLLTRFNVNIFDSVSTQAITKASYDEALEEILSRVAVALVELDARREQMKPPGSKAYEVLLKSMKLLSIARIDQLVPTLRRLVDNMQAEQAFQRDLRDLFGLDEAASRQQVLNVASILFGELGFATAEASPDRSSTSSLRH